MSSEDTDSLIARFENSKNGLKDVMTTTSATLGYVNDASDRMNRSLGEITPIIQRIQTKIATINDQIKGLKEKAQQLAQASAEIERLKQENTQLQQQAQSNADQLNKLKDEYSQLQQQQQLLMADKKKLSDAISNAIEFMTNITTNLQQFPAISNDPNAPLNNLNTLKDELMTIDDLLNTSQQTGGYIYSNLRPITSASTINRHHRRHRSSRRSRRSRRTRSNGRRLRSSSSRRRTRTRSRSRR